MLTASIGIPPANLTAPRGCPPSIAPFCDRSPPSAPPARVELADLLLAGRRVETEVRGAELHLQPDHGPVPPALLCEVEGGSRTAFSVSCGPRV